MYRENNNKETQQLTGADGESPPHHSIVRCMVKILLMGTLSWA